MSSVSSVTETDTILSEALPRSAPVVCWLSVAPVVCWMTGWVIVSATELILELVRILLVVASVPLACGSVTVPLIALVVNGIGTDERPRRVTGILISGDGLLLLYI